MVDINVNATDIEACHRLSTNSRQDVILKFVNRKNVEKALKRDSKTKLAACDMDKLGFGEDTKLYFNENLSPYYRRLAWMCRVLKRSRKIFGTWTREGKIYYKFDEDSAPVVVSHPQEIYDDFPSVDFE